ncbi:MAG: hypothetical protein H6605_10800 [Flavobacteriales bacterium]|nr:hypothetical protein [Flavobacteriales bacterium]
MSKNKFDVNMQKNSCFFEFTSFVKSMIVIDRTHFDYPSYGSPLIGRTYSSDTTMKYRFGFNTQEMDDEIYGEGNTTSAEFWEYDARLGRRWNIDPVNKPWQCDYMCLSNSPLSKVDYNGDDDYFNADGSFSYRTKTGNNIFIMDAKKVGKILSENNFSKENSKVLAKVAGHYAKEVGLDVQKLGGKDLSVANRKWVGEYGGQLTAISESYYNNGIVGSNVDIMNNDPKTNRISLILTNGELSSLLDDINNMKSALLHEKLHGEIKGSDGFEHLEVYYREVMDPTYQKTTSDFKNNARDNIEGLISKALDFQDANMSKTQIDAIHKKAEEYLKKFQDAGVIDKPKPDPKPNGCILK